MKIKSVTIEGMRNVKRKTYTFNDVTYLSGPNGAGKSTVLNAIQLALLGYIPGTAKSNASIMAHANCPELRVSVDLVRNDGEEVTVTRSFKKKGAGATSSVTVDPADVNIDDLLGDSKLPVFDWSEFTGMTSNKLKDWFIQFIPGMNTDINWSQELSSCIETPRYVKDIVRVYSCKLIELSDEFSAQQKVQEANKIFKYDLSYCKAALAEKESTLNGLIDYDSTDLEDVSVLESRISDIQNQIGEANKKHSEYSSKLSALTKAKAQQDQYSKYADMFNADILSEEETEDINNKISESTERYNELSDSYDKTEGLVKKYEDKVSENNKKASEVKSNITVIKKVTDSDGTCPYTQSECSTILTLKDSYQAQLDSLNKSLKDLLTENIRILKKVEEVESTLESLDIDKSEVHRYVASLKDKLQRSEEASKKLSSLSFDDSQQVSDADIKEAKSTLNDVVSRINELNSDKQEIKNKIKISNMVDKITLDKYMLQEKCDILNSWVKLTSANGLQTTLSSGGFDDLEDELSVEVEKVFGPGTTCKFNVSTKANSFSFGIDRNGSYIPYNLLSTGEKTLYAFALMLYIAKNSNSDLKVVMMDDFFDHLDSERFKSLMNAMESDKDDVQIIMAGVVPCEAEFVDVVNV